LSGSMKERDHSEELGVDGKIIFRMDLKEVVWKGVDWMHVS